MDVATHISPKFHILRLKYKCIRTSARNTRKQTAVDRGLRLDHHVTARVLAMALCLCLSVISRCSLEVVGRIEPVFGMEASFDQFYTVFQEIHVALNWNFFLNFGLRKFRHGISIFERAINLARERWTLRA